MTDTREICRLTAQSASDKVTMRTMATLLGTLLVDASAPASAARLNSALDRETVAISIKAAIDGLREAAGI